MKTFFFKLLSGRYDRVVKRLIGLLVGVLALGFWFDTCRSKTGADSIHKPPKPAPSTQHRRSRIDSLKQLPALMGVLLGLTTSAWAQIPTYLQRITPDCCGQALTLHRSLADSSIRLSQLRTRLGAWQQVSADCEAQIDSLRVRDGRCLQTLSALLIDVSDEKGRPRLLGIGRRRWLRTHEEGLRKLLGQYE